MRASPYPKSLSISSSAPARRPFSPSPGAAATLLAQAEVASVDEGTVAVRLAGDNATHADGLERQRDLIVEVLALHVADAVRVVVAPGASGAARPPRLTPEAVRADRLAQLRAADPSLNAAVDALDLELLE